MIKKRKTQIKNSSTDILKILDFQHTCMLYV